MTGEEGVVASELVDGSVVVTLRREQRRNALSSDMCVQLHAALTEACGRPDASAVVLTGAGISFCAGADLRELRGAGLAQEPLNAFLEKVQALTEAMHGCARPMIAAINGHAVGMGVEVALGADWRVASENASFAMPERSLRLDVTNGASWLLPQLVGAEAAEDMLGGRTLTAQEALQIGLVDEVIPADGFVAAVVRGAAARAQRGPFRTLTSDRLQEILQEESRRVRQAAAIVTAGG